MAVLAIGLIGSAIGSAIGGTFLGVAAASWGLVVGEVAGNLLFPQKSSQEGPRVGDLSVQVSTYGTPIPILFGTMRTAGNVIFCTQKREVKSEQESGGKGGPKVSTTTYSYNVDIAIALCEGPIQGIRKVWSNGKLVFDASDTASVGSTLASSVHAQGWKVYLGDEDQLPDPTIEATIDATLGSGHTPAYRGIAYVVFDHLDCPNGSVPQLSFEIVASGAAASSNPVFDIPPADTPTMASIVKNQAWQFSAVVDKVLSRSVGPGYWKTEKLLNFTEPDDQSTLTPIPVQGGAYAMYATFSATDYTHDMRIRTVDLESAARGTRLDYIPMTSDNALRPLYAAYDSVTGKFCAVGQAIDGTTRSHKITIMPGGELTDALMTDMTPMAFYDNVIYTCGVDSGITYLNSYDGSTGNLIDSVSSGGNNGAISLFVHADANGVYVVDNEPDDESRDRHVWKVDATNGWVVLTSTANFDNQDNSTRTWWSDNDYGIVGPSVESGGNVTYRVIRYQSWASDDVNVADIISALCTRAGADPSQIDVTDVAQTVHGYAITQVTSARANIDPLLRTFFIDAVESDDKLKFLGRAGKAAVASIPFEDLGCIEPGSDAVDAFALTRTQEAELPRSVALTYINYEFDYQAGTETARRQVTTSAYDVTDQIPIAATSGQIASTTATLLYDAWAQRTARKTTLPRTYAWFDVGDNVTVEYPKGQYSNKRITQISDDGVMLTAAFVDSDPDVYALTLPGATPAGGQDGVEFNGPTRLDLLDIPLLRDADDDPGLYAAMQGYSSGWNGAALYAGDTERALAVQTVVTVGAITGTAVSALADWQYNVLDNYNTVDVQLVSGSLSSTTRDAILDTDANACLIGDEILQFRTATSLGSGQYRLSGLRRGRRGTEWAAATHVAGDRFVLFNNEGMVRVATDLAHRNRSRVYQAVTIGQSTSESALVTFTNTAAGLKPLAPANFDIARDGSKLRMRWNRRSRLRDNWLAGSVPLAETTEAYEIDVVLSGGGKLTYTASASPLEVEAVAYTPAGLPGRGARFAVSSGGYIYTFDGTFLRKLDATTLVQVAQQPFTPPLVSFMGLAIVGSSLFGSTASSTTTAGGVLAKFDLNLNFQGFQAYPKTSDGSAMGVGLVQCASALWVPLAYSGVVRRYNPTTMLPVADVALTSSRALATDGSFVYVLSGLSAMSISKIDPGTNTITATIAIAGAYYGSELGVANGYAFMNGAADGDLLIYRLSDGVQMTHGMRGVKGSISVSGNYVCFCSGTGVVTVIDATTLTERGTFTLSPISVADFDATILSADRVLASTDRGSYADYYDRTAIGAGAQFNLYQISADVGRGFPAQRTL